MTYVNKNIEITDPKLQLSLYGFNDYFQKFLSIYKKGKLPNVILLSGPKGIGKATFAYHFINFILSEGEKNSYLINKFQINDANKTFNLINNYTHANFYNLKNKSPDEKIKIDQVRELIAFISKTNYNKEVKLILLDNAEHLNINSSNALLKAIEEPSANTYFFIVHNSYKNILDTIKSRSLRFNIYFNIKQKLDIFNSISREYNLNLDENILIKYLQYLTPGNLLRYLLIMNNSHFKDNKSNLFDIFFLIDMYKKQKDVELLELITFSIEFFFNDLSIKKPNLVNFYFMNKRKISNMINESLKFNLDKNNLLTSIDKIIKHAS